MSTAQKRPVLVSEESHESRYKLWRRYVPTLYEFVSTQLSGWPASCVELIDAKDGHWTRALEDTEEVTESTRLILSGTYSGDNKQDTLEVLRVEIPGPVDYEQEADLEEEEEFLQSYQVQTTLITSVAHDDEVLSARCMPQRTTIVASKSSSAVYLYDFRTNATQPKCTLLSKLAGVVLAWSPLKSGQLLVGTDDGDVTLMDVACAEGRSISLKSERSTKIHEKTVSGVEWHPSDLNRFFSCSQDGSICCWDIRAGKSVHTIRDAHGEMFGVNCVSFNPRPQSNYFLSGVGWRENVQTGEMNVPELPEVKLWDDRALAKGCIHEFAPLTSCIFDDNLGTQVYQTRWNPRNHDQFGACSGDGAVRIWDVKKVGTTFENAQDALDGPPELVFIHGGHTDAVSDFQWDSRFPDTCVSVADDNITMFWRPLLEL